jgi:hypothetical protein
MSILKYIAETYNISPSDRKDILYSPDGFNTKEEAEEYLDSLLNNYFPHGVKFKEDKVLLYRILFFYDDMTLNEETIGMHWTGEADNITDSHWVSLIRDANGYYSDAEKIFVLIGLFNVRNSIDIKHTLYNNLRYPNEFEYSLYEAFTNPLDLYIVSHENFNDKNPIKSEGIKKLL